MRGRILVTFLCALGAMTCAHQPPAEQRAPGQCPDFTGRYLFDLAACSALDRPAEAEIDLFPDGSPFPRVQTEVTVEQQDCDQVSVVVHGDRRVSTFYLGGEDAWWRGSELYSNRKTSGFAKFPMSRNDDEMWWTIAPGRDGGIVFSSGFSEWTRMLFIFPVYSGRKLSCNLRPL
jgi:hypothetical protein